jgi:hypothetical protein
MKLDVVHETEKKRKDLDARYDDLKSGKVKLVPGDEVIEYFRKKSMSARGFPSEGREGE